MQSLSKRVASLCLLLTLWSAVALVLHHHSSADEASSCQVCVSTHSTAPTSITAAPKPVFHKIFIAQKQPRSTEQRLIAFALSVRPSPVA